MPKKKPQLSKQAIGGISFSPYCEFTMKLRGFDIIERATDRKLMKVAVWDRHKNSARMTDRIKKRLAPGYLFVPHDRMKRKTVKT